MSLKEATVEFPQSHFKLKKRDMRWHLGRRGASDKTTSLLKRAPGSI
jgi:hypothetical protein